MIALSSLPSHALVAEQMTMGPLLALRADRNDDLELRVIGVLVILATSAAGALLPVLLKQKLGDGQDGKVRRKCVPAFFDFTKYLGSGVIISTAFVHLLSPAFETLKDPRLGGVWQKFDWAPVLAMAAVFAIFSVELLASRIGSQWLDHLGIEYEHHEQEDFGTHGPCEPSEQDSADHLIEADYVDNDAHELTDDEIERAPIIPRRHSHGMTTSRSAPAILRNFSAERRQLYCMYGTMAHKDSKTKVLNGNSKLISSQSNRRKPRKASSSKAPKQSARQILGVAVLEFGVLLHSFVVGLTLAVVRRFPTLAVVITLHQTFEGLGLGARLANLELPERHRWIPVTAAVLYAAITPAGMVLGLLVRNTYSPDSSASLVVSGVLDALSAGVLLYTGLVELLAAEFLFHQEMKEAPTSKVLYALACVVLGAIIMAVLGIWA